MGLLRDIIARSIRNACALHRPKTVEEVRQVTDAFATHYKGPRPHQGIACGNQPPRIAFPELPSLPRVPDLVNPDAWLNSVKGQHLMRKVNRQGFVKVDLYPYYLSNKLAGKTGDPGHPCQRAESGGGLSPGISPFLST